MELRNLQTYIKVCETMSFSKTADELGYVQSTITAQIAQLEEELGVKLFDRNGKTFRLNGKGEELLLYANRLVALSQEAVSCVSDTKVPKGPLRIGVVESVGNFLLPDILQMYLARFPAVQVQVVTATTREIMDMLRQDKIDLLLTLDEPVYDPDWTCVWSWEEDILFLCPPGHPFAGRTDISLAQLVRENLLLTERQCNYRHTFERICAQHQLPVRSSLEIGTTSVILRYIQKGLGLSLLPRLTARQDLEAGRLSSFQVREASIKMFIQLIRRKSKWCTPAMEAFIQTMPGSGENAAENS